MAMQSSRKSTAKHNCYTCRRRRVKCDKSSPICGPCHRLRLECLPARPASTLLWLPFNKFDQDGVSQSHRRTASSDGASKDVTEPLGNARRTAIFTVSQRQEMSEDLLRMLQDVDIDDLLLSLDSEEETACSKGPFSVFPSQEAEEDTVIRPTPWERDFLDWHNEINYTDWGSLENCFLSSASPPGQTPRGGNGLRLPSPQQGFDLSFPSPLQGVSLSPLDQLFSLSPVVYEPQDTVQQPPRISCSPTIPSPLSVHLPFLQPSEILKRVPQDTFFLLHHYGANMVFVIGPRPSAKPPWRTIHYPSALEATTALIIAEPVKHAQLALLHVILAVSCYHVDWWTTGTQPKYNNKSSHWWRIGEQHEQQAKTHLKIALKNEFMAGPGEKCKYKHVLMTLMCLVTTCVLKGTMENSRPFLIDAERVVRMRGGKPNPSKKVKLLHNILLYNKTICESTFPPPDTSESCTSPSSALSTVNNALANGVDMPTATSPTPGVLAHEAPAQLPFERLVDSDNAFFEETYGVPVSLVSLISQTTSLAQEADKRDAALYISDVTAAATFEKRVRDLEDRVCAFHWRATEPSPDDNASNHTAIEPGPASPSWKRLASRQTMGPYVTAMHQALLIFFYRRVRKLNTYTLQPFVKRAISALYDYQRVKEEYNIASPVPSWPGFIVGCEATDEDDRQLIRQWFQQNRTTWGSFEAIGDILERFWKTRDSKKNCGSSLTAMGGEITWDQFFRATQTTIITT